MFKSRKINPWIMAGSYIFLSLFGRISEGVENPKILEVRKIWDQGKHNAFTDLIRFQNKWYCTFRESEGHVGGDGSIRLLESQDGEEWKSVANITEAGIDLRDPKLSIANDGRLMIVAGGSVYRGGRVLLGRQPRVMFSKDGKNWTLPKRTLEEGDWLWRVTWHKGVAWGIAYDPQAREQASARAAANQRDAIVKGPANWKLKLVRSLDGENYETVTSLDVPGFANETTVRFLKDETMVAFIRRESGNRNGWIGTSKPPYREWSYEELNYRLGGPNFLVIDDGTIWASSRDHRQKIAKTAIGRMTTKEYEPELVLPSSGDNSYAGMVMHGGLLWMSYYSSHEGKSAIYLARLQLPEGRDVIKPPANLMKRVNMIMVGDSTMSSYLKPPADRPTLTGWGQVFGMQFQAGKVEVNNRAVSGMSTKTCLESGYWDKTLREEGQYVMIQFGHNDQPGKAKSSPAESTFRDNLKRMIADARQRAMQPILLTPVARRTFDKGHATSTLGPYVDAVKAVGQEMNVPVLDLHQASFEMFERLGDQGSEDYSPSENDRTHFSKKGAEKIAALVSRLLSENKECTSLARELK
jgi:lysophospholipase L1-like esterase